MLPRALFFSHGAHRRPEAACACEGAGLRPGAAVAARGATNSDRAVGRALYCCGDSGYRGHADSCEIAVARLAASGSSALM